MISNTSELEQTLPSLCEEVVRHLGAQNLESSYQKALKYELVNAGVEVLSEGWQSLTRYILPAYLVTG